MATIPGNSRRLQRSLLSLLVIAAIAALLLLPPAGNAAEEKSPEPQKPPSAAHAPAPPAVIPVADVATRATEVANLIEGITQKLAPMPEIETIRQSLPDISRQISQGLAETTEILRGQPALPTLQAQQGQWQQMQTKTTAWLELLTKRSNELQEALGHLAGLEKTWETTLKASQDSKAPGPTLQQINETLASIRAARVPLQSRLNALLDLQSSVSNEVAKCGSVLAKIAQVQKTSMTEILVQDSLPIWSPELWADSLTGLRTHIGSIGAAYLANVKKYLRDTSEGMPLDAGLLAAMILLFLTGRYQVRKLTAAGQTFSPTIRVFDHAIGAALTVALLLATSPFWPVPAALRKTFQVIAFAPMVTVIRHTVPARLVPGLYLLWILVTIDAMREVFSAELLIGQIILMIESLSSAAAVIWFLRNLRPALGEAAGSTRVRLFQSGSALVLLIIFFGLASASTGHVRLARLLTSGIIGGGMLAVTLYACVRVAMGIADLAFHVWPLRTLRMVQHNRDLIERRLYLLLIWMAILGWTGRYLNYIGFFQPSLSFLEAVLHAKYERGDFSISVGGVLEFFLTVWVAYLLSGLLRFVLREDVYPRIGAAPGKSYAVSSLLHYVILALGFIAGIAVLGVNLTKLTVLTGALGVGIGFGLQSVVNNFVSGLILLFERPIQVGDMVEVGDLLGRVLRIGIRASTVHTRQGADIIVPNSLLVTEKVTNWTLSDRLRRIDLPVGVNYGAVPREVIRLMEEVARATPGVLQDPAPQGLFLGYGDSSINFELRAWTDRYIDWQVVRSDIAVAVYEAVRAAGMSFPFPQREVRLLRDSKSAAATPPDKSVEDKLGRDEPA